MTATTWAHIQCRIDRAWVGRVEVEITDVNHEYLR